MKDHASKWSTSQITTIPARWSLRWLLLCKANRRHSTRSSSSTGHAHIVIKNPRHSFTASEIEGEADCTMPRKVAVMRETVTVVPLQHRTPKLIKEIHLIRTTRGCLAVTTTKTQNGGRGSPHPPPDSSPQSRHLERSTTHRASPRLPLDSTSRISLMCHHQRVT